jgi:predicted HAD superfamily phosphohydrolase YqeG
VKSLATGASAFTTFVQVAPRLVSLLGKMRPTWHLPALASVTPEFLRIHGVRGLIWDVDGVLTGDRRPELRPESAGPFRALLGAEDLRHVVLSNASEDRYRQLGELFPELPILRGYAFRGAVQHRKLHRGVDSWSAEELAARLGDGAHVIRKPSAELVEYAVRELGRQTAEVAMVGDQYLTDVAGANLGGVRSIKLPTLAPGTFRRSVRFGQVVEVLLYALVHGRARNHGA